MTEEVDSSGFAALLKAGVRLPAGVTLDQPAITPESAPSAFEEAARKFLAQQAQAQTPRAEAPAAPRVADDSETREAKELAALKPLKQFYIKQIEALIATAIDPNVIKALKDVIENIRDAKDPAAITAALANAVGSTKDLLSKVETPEAKVERLWGEVKELNAKAEQLTKELDKFATEEEKKKLEKLNAELEAAQDDPKKRLELIEKMNAIRENIAKRTIEHTEPGSPDHDKAKELLETIKNIRTLHQKSLETLSLSEKINKKEMFENNIKTAYDNDDLEYLKNIEAGLIKKLEIGALEKRLSQAHTIDVGEAKNSYPVVDASQEFKTAPTTNIAGKSEQTNTELPGL